MDAKTVVELLEPLVGRSERVVEVVFRGHQKPVFQTLKYEPNNPEDDPSEVDAILAVTLRDDGLVQIDLSEATVVFDAADVLYLSLISAAAYNKVKSY